MNAIATNAATTLVNGLLSVKPLAAFAKNRARNMMIKRAESIGVYWLDEAKQLKARGGDQPFNPIWETELETLKNPDIDYPPYYVTSFHAYEEGNLGWEPAMEVGVAARAVHARLWPEGDARGDFRLRQSYHDVLKEKLPITPQTIVDFGCSTGLSTFAIQANFPDAAITGVDLSPHFLTVAQYNQHHPSPLLPHSPKLSAPEPGASVSHAERAGFPDASSSITWLHAPAEATGLPTASADLVSACLIFHELPQSAAIDILKEARRLLKPGGYFTLMDMNPRSEVYVKMPPYVLTLLKSTEPYLDQYFALNIEQTLIDAGFESPSISFNSTRHRTIIARVK